MSAWSWVIDNYWRGEPRPARPRGVNRGGDGPSYRVTSLGSGGDWAVGIDVDSPQAERAALAEAMAERIEEENAEMAMEDDWTVEWEEVADDE